MENVLKNMNRSGPDYHAFVLLKLGFIIAPLVAGFDKLFNSLTDWTKYLAPVFPDLFNVTPSTFMMGVGVIEIMVGIGVAFKPRIFGHVFSAWLFGIILNLFILGNYYDVALRDLGLAIGAFALARLAVRHEVRQVKFTTIEEALDFKETRKAS